MTRPSTARPAIAVTGLGAVCALGDGVPAIVEAMREGRDGLREGGRIDLAALHPIRFAGWVPGGHADIGRWAARAATEAWAQAAGASAGVPHERVAIVVGTTTGDDGAITRIATVVGDALGARGPRWTVSTACASSANAIGLGADLLLAGDADLVIAGGAEALDRRMFAGFAALGVLAREKCAPFGETVGTALGEGAGFVVLERAAGRVPALGYLAGYGLSSDAFHETTPDPRGEGIARATLACLSDAGLEPADVDYVNAHATGTATNDDAEWRGLERALGPRASAIPVSASKGFLGHAQGAAGALESIATIACMRAGLVPPSLRIGRGRLRGPRDTVAEGRAREARIDVALSNSAAFGGSNAVLAFTREPRSRDGATRTITIAGAGPITTEAGSPRDEAALAAACGDVDLRTLDPAARLAVAAARRALADAGLKVRGPLRERVGVFGGTSRAPPESCDALEASLERGLDRASAPAFARTVPHAPIGAATRVLALRGPCSMVAGDGVAGLLAIAYAARWLRARDDADYLLAGGLDERPKDDEAEGAAFVLLGAGGDGPRIEGVATAGREDAAIARALADAGVTTAAIDAWVRPDPGAPTAVRSALAFIEAHRAVREGARRAVACAEGAHGAVAIVIGRGGT